VPNPTDKSAAKFKASAAACRWHIAVDTGAEPPADLFDPGQQPVFTGTRRLVGPRSLVVLEGHSPS
jgi:hypothetical protein